MNDATEPNADIIEFWRPSLQTDTASNMDRLGLNLMVIVVILTALAVLRTGSSAVDSSSHSSRSCVYSFQVWTPNQDVLAKLRRIEERCDAVRSSVDREVRLHM